MDRFRAYRINDEGGKIIARFQDAAFEARANPELGHAIVGTSLLAALLEARRGR